METLLLLHGFAGTGRSWAGVERALAPQTYRPLAPDLPGHGTRSSVRPVTFAACVEAVLAAAPPRFALAGYSMGGRVALHVALAAPERITRLGLIATTAGIEDPDEAAARRASDEALAEWAERRDIAAFADRWGAQGLFAGDPPAVRELARVDTLRNDPEGLAAALRGIGSGAMVPLWERLGELTMPATVLAGERDPKFRAIGRRLADALPDATYEVVPGTVHALTREAPVAVAAALTALAAR